MKIGIIVNHIEGGGLENLLINITKELLEHNEIEFITTVEEGSWVNKVLELGVKVFNFNTWTYKDPVTYIEKLAEFINSRTYSTIFLNNSIHGMIATSFIDCTTKKVAVLHGIERDIFKLTTTKASSIDQFIAISPLTYQLLVEKNIENVSLIPNGIYLSKERETQYHSEIKLKLIFAGRISHSDKGALFVPEIFRRIKMKINSCELIVLGDGPDLNKFKELIKKYELHGVTKYFGMVDSEIVLNEMSECHFLLFPSIHEGFGLSIIEAQSVGCIPVATEIVGVTDYLINNHIDGILINSLDVDDFSNEIVSVYKDKELMDYLSKNAMKNAEKFNIKETATKWLEISMDNKVGRSGGATTGIKDIICMLNYKGSKNVILKKNEWLCNYYYRKHSNLAIIKKSSRIIIFGTLETAYYIYIDALKHGLSIVAFIDNYSNKEQINSITIWNNEKMCERADEFDVVISSIDSNNGDIIIEEIKRILPGKFVIDWKEIN